MIGAEGSDPRVQDACPHCGKGLSAQPESPPSPVTPPVGARSSRATRRIELTAEADVASSDFTAQRERRIVTVLFADIVGFTAMTGRMDVEDLTRLLDTVFDTMTQAIHEFGGIVDKYLGDAAMAVFGAPVAHEDDPERAVRAALRMKREVAKVASDTGLPIRLGVGINTGPVIAGAFGSRERADYTVIGDTVNLASRLEGMAEPGQILVTQATRDRCIGSCDVIALGERPIKGKPHPLPIYEVRELSDVGEAGSDRVLVPIVGRASQVRRIGQLFDAIRPATQKIRLDVVDAAQTESLGGGVILCFGEVGAGKSRLLLEARTLADERGHQVVAASGDGWSEGLGRDLGAGLLRGLLDLPRTDVDPNETREKLLLGIEGLGLEAAESKLGVLMRFLGHTLEGAGRTATDRVREDLRDSLLAIFRAAAIRRPLVILADNLQWADQEVLEVLTDLAGLATEVPLALIGFARTGSEEALQAALPDADVLTLPRLDVRRSGELAAHLLGVDRVPPEFAALMAERTGGSPFFIEETVKDLLARGTVVHGEPVPQMEELQIPSTVQEVIVARIDRLEPDTKGVLQVASVIGRTFRRDVLAQVVSGEDGPRLDRHLAELETSQFIFPLSSGANAEYMFRHNVTRDVAYQTLLRRNRATLHGRIAAVLEATLGKNLEEEVHTLAHHYLETDQTDKKAEYLVRAGRADHRRGNFSDAERYLLLADDVLGPRAPERDELDQLLSRLYAQGSRYREAVERLSALIERTEDSETRYSSLVDRGHYHLYVGDISLAEDDLRRVISADAANRTVAAAYRVLALLRRDQGRGEAALQYCSLALRLLEDSEDEDALADAWLAYADTLIHLDRSADALEAYQKARALFDRLGDKERLASVYNNIGVHFRQMGDLDKARHYYEMSLEIAVDLGVWRQIATAQHNLGNLLSIAGKHDEAMQCFEEALRLREQHGARRHIAVTLMAMAETRRQNDEWEAARDACERGIQIFTELGLDSVLPQAYSDLAAAEIHLGNLAHAEELLDRAEAKEIAHEEVRRSVELQRAELLHARGKTGEADEVMKRIAARLAASAGAEAGGAASNAETAPEIALEHATLIQELDPDRALRYLQVAEDALDDDDESSRAADIRALKGRLAPKA